MNKVDYAIMEPGDVFILDNMLCIAISRDKYMRFKNNTFIGFDNEWFSDAPRAEIEYSFAPIKFKDIEVGEAFELNGIVCFKLNDSYCYYSKALGYFLVTRGISELTFDCEPVTKAVRYAQTGDMKICKVDDLRVGDTFLYGGELFLYANGYYWHVGDRFEKQEIDKERYVIKCDVAEAEVNLL